MSAGLLRRILGGLLVLLLVVVAFGLANRRGRCLEVNFDYRATIEDDLKGNILLGSMAAVRSEDFEQVWFVAGQIPSGGVAVWSTNADPTQPNLDGVFIVANDAARSVSDFGVDNASADLPTMADDGAEEAVGCVS